MEKATQDGNSINPIWSKTMPHRIKPALVRIIDNDDEVIGVGFLVTRRHIVTCAHVIGDAIDVDCSDQNIPTQSINFDFPFIEGEPRFSSNVITWHPCDATKAIPTHLPSDIAILEIDGEIPLDAYPAHLVKPPKDRGWHDHSCIVCGFASIEGGWTNVQILEQIAGGCIQFQGITNLGHFIEGGYSGSALLDKDYNGVTGIIVARELDTGQRVAYAIPIYFLEDEIRKLGGRVFPGNVELVPVPIVICAMNNDEVNSLMSGNAFTQFYFNKEKQDYLKTKFAEFSAALKGQNITNIDEYYKADRNSWSPPILGEPINQTIEFVLAKYYEQNPKKYLYPLYYTDSYFSDGEKRSKALKELNKKGYILIIDGISTFHPYLHQKLTGTELETKENVSLLVVPPIGYTKTSLHNILEGVAENSMGEIFKMFAEHLKTIIQFNVNDSRDLKRWLFSILAHAVIQAELIKPLDDNRKVVRDSIDTDTDAKMLIFG